MASEAAGTWEEEEEEEASEMVQYMNHSLQK
jgi:hypothetical protein